MDSQISIADNLWLSLVRPPLSLYQPSTYLGNSRDGSDLDQKHEQGQMHASGDELATAASIALDTTLTFEDISP